jgi:DNA-binding transcriptional MerR regulator
LRIGELAKASGLSAHSIRWYESRRLIPGVRRNVSGHRDFNEWHVAWLALLDRLKRTGMSIKQMVAYADLVRRGDSTLPQQRAMFAAHRERAAADLAMQQRALKHIDEKITFLDRWIETGMRPPVAVRLQPTRPRPPDERPGKPSKL